MSAFDPQIIFQTLYDPLNPPATGGPPVVVDPPVSVPLLKVVGPTGDVVEGTPVRVVIQRSNNIAGTVAADWTAVAPAGDLTDIVAGTVTMPTGTNSFAIAIKTVDRAGLQAEPRQIRVTLSNPSGGGIDPAGAVLDIPIRNRTSSLPTWYNQSRRSGRLWASGTSGLTGSLAVDPNAPLEQSVALNDIGFGSSRGPTNSRVATWDGVVGGPVGGVLLTAGTQFDWSDTNSFGLHFQRSPLSSTWLVWNMVLIPTLRATNTGDASVWTEISSGGRDAEFQAMGARIKQAFAAQGHDLARFIGVPHIAMNAGDYYQVFDTTRLAYKAAMERAISQIRSGAATPTLRFAHCPASSPRLGTYLEWTPNNVDAVGLDWSFDQTVVDALSLGQRIDATGPLLRYGLTTDLLDAADKLNVPLLLPRWVVFSDAVQGCPYAAEAITYFSGFLFNQKARVVGDCIANLNILNTGAYLAGPPGDAVWPQAVANYDLNWDGTKSGQVYTPPTISIVADAATVSEGDT